MSDLRTTTFVSWYGSNRTNADAPAREIGPVDYCAVPFCGGLSDAYHIKARSMLCSDLHRHLINLCNVVKDRAQFRRLRREARVTPFHPDVLEAAQQRCRLREAAQAEATGSGLFVSDAALIELSDRYQWAFDYWVCAWMGRSAKAGTNGELAGNLSTRFNAGGGDSAVRFRSATAGLRAWHRFFERVNFTCADAFAVLDIMWKQELEQRKKPAAKRERRAIYVDSPWPEDGDPYRHSFTIEHQKQLATSLERFELTRVVVRYGDHEMIRALYPEPRWSLRLLTGRDMHNKDKGELLIANGPSLAASAA